MSEKEKAFTVSDRRHFTADGAARDAEQPADAPQSRTAGGGGATSRTAGGPVTLAEFLLSLGAQAAALLGESGEERSQALEGARQIVSILEMLEDKTSGRRTEEESRVLEELLFQLRMAYVQRVSRT